MKKNSFILIITLLFNYTYSQQNLVPNGSFEDTVGCPNYANGYFIDKAKSWFMPTNGTSDYFNVCSTEFDNLQNTLLFSVPQNYEGHQIARTGDAYGGYYASLNPSNNNYYEYVSVKLTSTLKESKKYKLTYYLSLVDSFIKYKVPKQYSNYSAAYLSSIPINQNNYLKIPCNPQVKSDPNLFINDSLGWQKIEGIFTAIGNENYLTIGYFCDYQELKTNYFPSPDSSIAVYYYIDDVSLVEYEETSNCVIPETITPNNDAKNDIFKIDCSQFIEENFSIQIFNRWGNQVYQSNQLNFEWNGTYKNQPLPSSTYYLLITATKRDNTPFIYKGFIQLIY